MPYDNLPHPPKHYPFLENKKLKVLLCSFQSVQDDLLSLLAGEVGKEEHSGRGSGCRISITC